MRSGRGARVAMNDDPIQGFRAWKDYGNIRLQARYDAFAGGNQRPHLNLEAFVRDTGTGRFISFKDINNHIKFYDVGA